jgi:hypothetical protein
VREAAMESSNIGWPGLSEQRQNMRFALCQAALA